LYTIARRHLKKYMNKYPNISNEDNIQANFRFKIKGDEVGWACSKHEEEEEFMKGSSGKARRKETNRKT
jgi:hypothetical protein